MRILLVLPLLAGCSTMGMSPTQIAQADQSKCIGYGFKVGTDAYAQCRLQLDAERAEDNRSRKRAFAAIGANLLNDPQPVTCHSTGTTFGSMSNTTTTCR